MGYFSLSLSKVNALLKNKEVAGCLAGTQFELGAPQVGGAVYKMYLSPEN